MSLAGWLASGWLVKHEARREEIAHLLAIVDRDLDQCAIELCSGLSARIRI